MGYDHDENNFKTEATVTPYLLGYVWCVHFLLILHGFSVQRHAVKRNGASKLPIVQLAFELYDLFMSCQNGIYTMNYRVCSFFHCETQTTCAFFFLNLQIMFPIKLFVFQCERLNRKLISEMSLMCKSKMRNCYGS